MTRISRTRDLFLFSMAVIYLAAFCSLYVQIPGLYGDNGILPAKAVIGEEADSWDDLLNSQPSLLKLTPKLGLSVQQGMDLLCMAGMVVSFLCVVCKTMRDTVSFILLWMLYFSLYQVGQTFLWFQWYVLFYSVELSANVGIYIMINTLSTGYEPLQTAWNRISGQQVTQLFAVQTIFSQSFEKIG